MNGRGRRAWPIVLASFAGASVWASLGEVALTGPSGAVRIAAFPPVWWLGALAVGGAVAAGLARLAPARAWPLLLAAVVWLPYLPLRVPAVLVAWDGPIETIVWALVVAGVAFGDRARAPEWASRLVSDPRRAPWVAGALAAACFAAGWAGMARQIPGGDEPHYLVITQSLLLDGDLKIENNHQRGDHLDYFNRIVKPDYLTRGTDGEIYSVHPLGVALLVLPGFAAFGYAGAALTVMAIASTATAIAWHAAWMLAASAGAAWVGWAAVALTAPYFFHGFTIYPDGVGGLFVVAGVWLLVAIETGRAVGRRRLVLVGAALSALPWTHTRFAAIAAALGAVLAARLWSRSTRTVDLVALFAAPAVSAAAWFAHFWFIWGSVSPAAPYAAHANTSLAYAPRGVLGLLVDQQFGAVANAPVLALAIVGMGGLAARRRRLAVELAAVAAPYVVAAGSYAMWWGGVSGPARFVAALIPTAALPVAWWWRHRTAAPSRALALALLLASVVLVAARAGVQQGAMVYNARDGYDLLLDWAASSADLPKALPALHRDGESGALADALVWAAAGACVLGLAAVLDRRRGWSRGGAWATMAAAGIVASMAAATIVWARRGESGATVERSQYAFLHGWTPEARPTVLLLPRVRRLDEAEVLRRVEVASDPRAGLRPGDPTVFRASWVPAGEYDVFTDTPGTLGGELIVRMGRTELAAERWRLEGRQRGYGGFTLRLPVAVHSVSVMGDPEARASVSDFRLRVRRRVAPAAGDTRFARQAARYGNRRVFFMDEHVWVEPNGFWTQAGYATRLVIDGDGAEAPALTLQTGPVPTTVTIAIGGRTERLALGPHTRQTVALGERRPGDTAWVVDIRTGAGFRPRDHDPGNGDTRSLGVWLEIP